MKRVFISLPMKNLRRDEILEKQYEVIRKMEEYLGEPLELIQSFNDDFTKDSRPLEFLGKAIEKLSKADYAVFCEDWDKSRGCVIEYKCCQSYGIEIIFEDAMVSPEYFEKIKDKRVLESLLKKINIKILKRAYDNVNPFYNKYYKSKEENMYVFVKEIVPDESGINDYFILNCDYFRIYNDSTFEINTGFLLEYADVEDFIEISREEFKEEYSKCLDKYITF